MSNPRGAGHSEGAGEWAARQQMILDLDKWKLVQAGKQS